MERKDRIDILENLLHDLKNNKEDSYELYGDEVVLVLDLLEKWDSRRKYLNKNYYKNRSERIEDSKRRYREKRGLTV